MFMNGEKLRAQCVVWTRSSSQYFPYDIMIAYFPCCNPSATPADGESKIVCTQDFTVFKNEVTITDSLVVDAEISCSYIHVLTADDVNELERKAIVTVTARDEYDYQVESSFSEVVSLSQVKMQGDGILR